MSMNFSTLVTKLDLAAGTNVNSYPLANKAIDINLAQDEALAAILENGGWNIDDFNQTDYPIITTNLVSGQRDYSFVRDGSGNLILDIYKVQVKGQDGIYRDLYPVDQQLNTNYNGETIIPVSPISLTDGQNASGTPTRYDKTGNAIFLDLVPNYSSTGGLRIFIDREMTYFTSADTTKVSGIDGLCHDFLYLKPAYEWARDKGLNNAERLFRDLNVSMAKLKQRYGIRERDIRRRMTPSYESNK